MQYHRFALIALVAATALPIQAQEQITLDAARDNTLFESDTGSLSNGAGNHLFAGSTGAGGIRRGLVFFDVSDVPEAATVQSVTLTLRMSRSISAAQNISLHRLTADWGEGTSHAFGEEGGGAAPSTGDATWIHRFFNTEPWQQAGGDFLAEASATVSVADIADYVWGSTELMVADVQSWVADSESNFGWILLGNESTGASAKRFDSRETPATAPSLQITYSTGVAVEEVAPTALRLGKNYPDPFADASIIPFELDAPSRVRIDVYDVLGRTVRTLVDATLAAGLHEVEVVSSGMTNGLYAYCFQSGSGRQCRTMVVSR
jgi:hypothetical protein